MPTQEQITKIKQGLKGISPRAQNSTDYETADEINRSVTHLQTLLLDLRLELEPDTLVSLAA